jgi:hypothetical protein
MRANEEAYTCNLRLQLVLLLLGHQHVFFLLAQLLDDAVHVCHMRRRTHVCHMRRRTHVCHMRRRIHACHTLMQFVCVMYRGGYMHVI